MIIAKQVKQKAITYEIQVRKAFFVQERLLVQSDLLADFEIGSSILLTCKLMPITADANFLLFNFKTYSNSMGRFKQCFAQDIVANRTAAMVPLYLRIKVKLINYIATFDPVLQPYLHAFILGSSSGFGDSRQIFIEIGIAHILAVSGSHLGLLKKISAFLGRLLRVTKETVDICFFVFLWFYTLMLLQNISFLRASLTLWLYKFYEDFAQKKITFEQKLIVLLGIAIFFVFLNPFVIFNIGFQYSFICSFYLLINSKMDPKKIRSNIGCILSTSAITSYLQQSVFLLPFLATFLFTPIFSLIYLLIWLLLCFKFLSPLIKPIISGVDLLVAYSDLANIRLTTPLYFMWQVYLLAFIALYLAQLILTNKLVKMLKVTLAFILISFTIFRFNFLLNSIHFLSLPYGECTIIKIGEYAVIIDTGGSIQADKNELMVKNIIIPYLNNLQITKIDALVLTHDDIDHTGALNQLLLLMPVAHIYINNQSTITIEPTLFPKMLPKITRVSAATRTPYFYLLPAFTTTSSSNDASIVVYGRFGQYTWLFMGDLELKGEEQFLRLYPNIKADVLKLGHHGSKTSTSPDFLQAIEPKYGIISVQSKNIHKHPHKEVTSLLSNNNIKYWITNQDGSQSFFFLGPISFFKH
ncbi:MAG: ComEC/Rec2 family competence protein [Culicoidibacterales bacterium]